MMPQENEVPRCYWCCVVVKDSQLQLHTDPLQPLSCGRGCTAKRRPCGEGETASEPAAKPVTVSEPKTTPSEDRCLECGYTFGAWGERWYAVNVSNGGVAHGTFCSKAHAEQWQRRSS